MLLFLAAGWGAFFSSEADGVRELWSTHSALSGNSVPAAVDVDPFGNVFRHEDRSYVTKFSGESGIVLWRREFRESEGYVIDSKGDVFVADGTNLLKVLGSTAETVWERSPGIPGYRAWRPSLDLELNVLVIGLVITNTNEGLNSFHVSKYSRGDGTRVWEKKVEVVATQNRVLESAIAPNGDLILFDTAETNINVRRVSCETGEVLWSRTHAETNAFIDLTGAIVATNGNIALIGTGFISGVGHVGYTANFDANNGERHWSRWNGPWNDHSLAVTFRVSIAADGGVITSARELSSTVKEKLYDIGCLTKYHGESGALLWERKFDVNGSLRPAGLLLDNEGRLLYGATYWQGETEDALIYKIDSESGDVIWQRSFPNMEFIDFDLQDDFLVIAGGSWLSWKEPNVRAFRIGPELSTRAIESGAVEFEWARERLGWRLQKLVGGLHESRDGQANGTVHQWETITGSQETNIVRMNVNDSVGTFRLSKD